MEEGKGNLIIGLMVCLLFLSVGLYAGLMIREQENVQDCFVQKQTRQYIDYSGRMHILCPECYANQSVIVIPYRIVGDNNGK